MAKCHLYYDELESPVGPLTIITYKDDVVRIDFGSIDYVKDRANPYLRRQMGESFFFDPSHEEHAIKQELNDYFSNERREFTIPCTFYGTSFQKQVWEALLRIPYGETVSYKDIADRIGKPRAARAVGGAVNKNPFSIVVPCHRVVGSNGNLVGYGGGLDRKEFLLNHEKFN